MDMALRWELVALLLMLLAIQCVADWKRVFPLHVGNAAGSHDPKYGIEFHEPHNAYVPEDPDTELVPMTDREGKKFDCFLPKQLQASKDETGIELSEDTKSSRKTPEELLEVLKDKCVIMHEGWWTYELCYHGKLRQVHLENKQETQEFVLGVYDQEATETLHKDSVVSVQKDPRSQTAAKKYYAHMYTNGTKCDLTNEPRKAEVRFVCSESGTSLISSIKEAPTCRYTVVFQTPILCKHPLFQEERHPWLVINCNALYEEASRVIEEDRPVSSRLEMLPVASEAEDS